MFQPAPLPPPSAEEDAARTPPPLTPELEAGMASILIDNGDIMDDVDVDAMPERKPHFLDYDAVPPPEYEENYAYGPNAAGEQLKMDKKYERDGEISDYELAASGYTKKEFTQDDNTLHFTQVAGQKATVSAKPKHFLDENPIPPDYMLAQELREHRSLDRNFERQAEQQKQQQQRTSSPAASLSGGRKNSVERSSGGSSRASRERNKEPSYTLSRFLDGDVPPLPRVPKGAAWTESFEERYGEADDTLGSKVECVYSLLSMLGSNDPLEMSKKFLELSGNAQTCATLRRSGCMPLLVQMMHAPDNEETVRKYASLALHNVVHSHPDEKAGRREAKVLRLLDQIMDYCNFLKTLLQSGGEAIADDSDRHPLAAISSLMKVSFDEEHRHAMCELGALQAIPNLVHLDHAVHGPKPEDQCCNSLRRYALMALTNLTFGDENNKALLCGQKQFMEALVAQLDSAPDDLLQVTASVLRNLSWRADQNMKAVLNEIGTVTALALAAMKNKSENTLKAILSALWNLSAHCSTNKAEFCAVDGALAFLVRMLSYEGPSKTLKIIENAGGILRNVSSHIAVCEPYRQVLREHNCLSILLQQLKSESLTVVSNSCGTLWNLSARCPEDQKFLWDNGAVPMLRSLIHSKHAMISEGSSSALKNLLNFRPAVQNQHQLDPIARSMGLKKLPTLTARKQKALQQELGEKHHEETCDNLDMGQSSSSVTGGRAVKERSVSSNLELLANGITRKYPLVGGAGAVGGVAAVTPTGSGARLTRSALLTKSESRDSVFSAKSDTAYEHLMRSHSASEAAARQSQFPTASVAAVAFELEHDVEAIEEQPIDYSVKYNESVSLTKTSSTTYQETDLDQPTDFSLRYAENQIESDVDISPPEVANSAEVQAQTQANPPPTTIGATAKVQTESKPGQEILLILEDSVKCYQTEDTPYVISNAASVTDLQQAAKSEPVVAESGHIIKSNGRQEAPKKAIKMAPQYGSGSYTPEKPINYCEEGTPGYFSRYDSLSSLDDSSAVPAGSSSALGAAAPQPNPTSGVSKLSKETDGNTHVGSKPTNSLQTKEATPNSALETPLMFSRRSSMDSLVNEDVGPCDDKSSVVSDFSRLASGVISPSELPDSPTQSMPQSPRRNSANGQPCSGSQQSPIAPRSITCKRPLRSVFEDDLSTFNVEHTPAQFSCATSLSNLSIVDDEQPIGEIASSSKPGEVATATQPTNCVALPSEGEEDEFTNMGNNNDDLLLASCINIGMNRTAERKQSKQEAIAATASNGEEPLRYCTEDTPALLSKVGSNTNLSAISINSNDAVGGEEVAPKQPQRYSLNLSDDVSSNASESGAAAQSADLLQQCIRVGMQKPSMDAIAMLRRGGNVLPAYLPVGDEMNKYLVEDSPCNFSVVSGLSNLTVGSSLVGPAVQLQEHTDSTSNNTSAATSKPQSGKVVVAPQEDVRRQHQWQDDSLSSLSIDSEDDTNLLSQAIAAGCNRPKSNLGFSSTNSTTKRSSSLSSSQPMAINAATSASSLNSAMTARNYQRQLKQRSSSGTAAAAQNESYSSVDSSDSNENQSKSLFELCILKGMYKSKEPGSTRKQSTASSSTQSNPNLKQFDSLPVQLSQPKSYTPSRQRHHHHHHHHHRERERERKDEKLLQECINTGISKKIGSSGTPTPTHAPLSTAPKNAQATSAAALEPCHPMAATTLASVSSTAAAPDVVKRKVHGQAHSISRENSHADITDALKSPAAMQCVANLPNLANGPETKVNATGSRQDADGDDRSSDESNQSFIMDTMVRLDACSASQSATASTTSDKHKDPDLMLKSVERLTLEFVTSAEQLRTGSSSQEAAKPLGIGTGSHNTWNENTCPNDISFPSVSMSAPVLASLSLDDDVDGVDIDEDQATEADVHKDLHDFAEITPTNEVANMLPSFSIGNGLTQPNSLETETDTLVSANGDGSSGGSSGGLNFQLGGEVQSAAAVVGCQPTPTLLFNGTSASIMTNSTMIAYEARALAENLHQLQAGDRDDDDNTELTFSINSLDLDNVRPPSGMESLNMSGCYQEHSTHQPSSLQLRPFPSKSPKFPRKGFPGGFPAGLVAKRALGQLAGSAESVNSSCNLLDNIKPPSLMDELLDSMISVDSIQSEVAEGEHGDCSMATTISVSNYETAAGGDDNTLTVLQSCCDQMPRDEDEEDATMNDFSSAESTPKHSATPSPNRRTLTPKQKRRVAKDRYKTYTIATGPEQLNALQKLALETDETLQIEIVETIPRAGGRRRGSADRYKTQVIECPKQVLDAGATTSTPPLIDDDCPSDQLSSIRAMMQKFTYITSEININPEEPSLSLPTMPAADDCQSCECDQNSETESCHGREQFEVVQKVEVEQEHAEETTPPATKPVINKLPSAASPIKTVRGRKKPAYVSPYSMQSQRAGAQVSTKNKTLAPTISKRSAPCTNNIARPSQKKKIANAGATSTPAPAPAPARLERQGTFVKDEPTNINTQVPVVEAAASTSPSHRTSKLPTKRTTPTSSPKRTVPATRQAATPQRANTNIRLSSAKAAAASRVAIQATRVSSTTPPSRSNSNLSGQSAAAAAAAKISQAQSRIANIWKRVDEAKTKPAVNSNLKIQQTKSSNTINGTTARKPTLLRSSTFDNTPPVTAPSAIAKSKLPVVGRK